MTIPNSFSRKTLSQQSIPLTLLPQNPVPNPSLSGSLPHASTPNTVFFYTQPMPSTKLGNLMELAQPGINVTASQVNPAFLANSSHSQLSLGNLSSSNQQTCIQHSFSTSHILSQLNPQSLFESNKKSKTSQLKEKNKSEKDSSTKDNSKYKKSFQRFGTLNRQKEQEQGQEKSGLSVSLINRKEISGESGFKQNSQKDQSGRDLKNTGPDGAKCERQINQDELKLTSINQNSHSLLNKRNLLNMLETEKQIKFQKIKTSNKQSPLQISPNLLISPESLQDSTAFASKLGKMKQTSPYKKLHTETPSIQPQAVSQIVYSAIPYQQMPLNFPQANPFISGTPNQVMMNPQLSFGNPPQSQILIPASFPMQDKMMAPVMIPTYPGAQAGGFVPNGQCVILMNQPTVVANQPTIIANQPITFNIQNNFNSVPPNYQQAPKIEYITNLYCPNSNNNVFTSDSWLG